MTLPLLPDPAVPHSQLVDGALNGVFGPLFSAGQMHAYAREAMALASAHPVAHLWQHGETGRTRIVMPDQIVTTNASWSVIGPLFLGSTPATGPDVSLTGEGKTAPAPEPVAWALMQDGECIDVNTQRWITEAALLEFDGDVVPLYAAPQPAERQPLPRDPKNQHAIEVPGFGLVSVKAVRAVEAAHGITAPAAKDAP